MGTKSYASLILMLSIAIGTVLNTDSFQGSYLHSAELSYWSQERNLYTPDAILRTSMPITMPMRVVAVSCENFQTLRCFSTYGNMAVRATGTGNWSEVHSRLQQTPGSPLSQRCRLHCL